MTSWAWPRGVSGPARPANKPPTSSRMTPSSARRSGRPVGGSGPGLARLGAFLGDGFGLFLGGWRFFLAIGDLRPGIRSNSVGERTILTPGAGEVSDDRERVPR